MTKCLSRCLLLLWTATASAGASVLEDPSYVVDYERPYLVPSVRLADLQQLLQAQRVLMRDALASSGLLAVEMPASAVATGALQHWCECTSNHHRLDRIPGTDRIRLSSDAATRRTSLATATLGMHDMLALPRELRQECGLETLAAMERLREQVATASQAFVEAVDQWISGSDPDAILLRNQHGGTYTTLASIVQASQQLEHFHVYQQSPPKQQPPQDGNSDSDNDNHHSKPALRLHTDVGLFLAFVPAHLCDDSRDTEDQSFVIIDPEHDDPNNHHHQQPVLRPAVFPPNSIGIMMGTAAQQWIQWPLSNDNNNKPLIVKATRHAVYIKQQQQQQTSSSTFRRAWYGRMHLLPESALLNLDDDPHNPSSSNNMTMTFGQLRQDMILRKDNLHSRTFAENNGGSSFDHDETETLVMGCGHHRQHLHRNEKEHQPFRRLEHVENADACNNQTNFYCWMSCLEIPQAEQASQNIQQEQELYCLDPSVLAGNNGNVALAQQPCIEQGVLGLAMNTNCMGWWAPAASKYQGAYVQPLNLPAVSSSANASNSPSDGSAPTPLEQDEPFCYGGTSMYMDGFNWIGSTCPIYLFPDLVLDTPGSLVLACFVTVVVCLVLEGIILTRRTIPCLAPNSTTSPNVRLVVSACFYGIQLTIGYLIMLVVMIYSVPLFLSVVLGLMLGHVLISSPDSVYRQYQSKQPTPGHHNRDDYNVVAEEKTGASTSTESPASCCLENKTLPRAAAPLFVQRDIPEGSTPCCQYS